MKKYSMYTTKEIKPTGWIKRQLEIQAKGLSGNLDKIWPDVRDSAWIGGDKDGWERVPYWLDGFIPLAYLLDNEDMISRAKKYIDAILDNQKENGWICPCDESEIPQYDTWVVQLISKVLIVYYECSGDERIPGVVYNVLKNYYDLLKSGTISLFRWGKSRWFETFIAINWLFERCSEQWIKELAQILIEQGTDYQLYQDLWKTPINREAYADGKGLYETHIVSIVMMLKSEAVSCDIIGEKYKNKAKQMYDILKKYNGTAVGTFTGDEHLAGLSPIRGTELCSVVEQMYSYELLYAYTGNKFWLEQLELLAFNALPATLSDDMWTHQYVQMTNQIACQNFRGNPIFGTNVKDAHLFGLEPNYGCCTANFNQGWPKFVLSAFMYNKNEIINTVPIPCELKTDGISIKVVGEYPFRNKFSYEIKTDSPVKFNFKIRIPQFAEKVKINGEIVERKDIISFNKIWTNEKLDVEYILTEPKLIKRDNNLYALKYGSLVFSLPIQYEKKMYEYEKDGIERKFPYCDYEYLPKTNWNYGFLDGEFQVIESDGDETPFSSKKPSLVIKTKMVPIDWGYEEYYDNVCARKPKSRIPAGTAEEKELYPYGCSKLRMTEMPIIKK